MADEEEIAAAAERHRAARPARGARIRRPRDARRLVARTMDDVGETG
ncbi:MAG TPA: hypothetical protein VIA45_01450 [Thermoanaerobaculia bacterium]|jgi:hypothetical protein